MKMEKIIIHYGIQGNGMRFNLSLGSYKAIKTLFPDAQPAKGLFVEYDFRTNFAEYHPHLENYIFPALLGLANQSDLTKIQRVDFVKTPERIVTYTIELNLKQNQHEQNIQPLLG
jgi:hypothetical protein